MTCPGVNAGASGRAGSAFTTIPIGSEVHQGRPGPPRPCQRSCTSPVAVTAIDFGFNVNTGATGQLTKPLNLTPSLLAKALTQVYPLDLPDYGGANGLLGPAGRRRSAVPARPGVQRAQLRTAPSVPWWRRRSR